MPNGQPEVVSGVALAEVLEEWMRKYLAERPLYEHVGGNGPVFIGPKTWLANETGIASRRINGLFRAEFPYVSYKQVEIILIAIDKLYLLNNGVLEVVPNPNWSLKEWIDYMEDRGCI